MDDHMRRKWISLIWPNTLKGRLAILLFIAAFLPIVLTGYISYYWMYKVQVDKVEKDIQQVVAGERAALEKILADLENTSQLLSNNGGIGQNVVDFMGLTNEYEKTKMTMDINRWMNNISYSNPSLGVMLFYLPDREQKIWFSNTVVDDQLSLNNLPVLFPANRLMYYGPHPSISADSEGELVVSLARRLEDVQKDVVVYIYLESKLDSFHSVLSQQRFGMNISHLITTPDGRIIYNTLPAQYRAEVTDKGKISSIPGYRVFSSENRRGWSIHALVPLPEYQREINKWLIQFILVSSLSIVVTVTLAWLIWKMVSRPLKQINKEITSMGHHQFGGSAFRTNLQEFDVLIRNFHEMRARIWELIREVEMKEKRRGQLEVEKLLVQINPHFLHNTLNTIQSLARIHGQADIARLVAIFTRVLHYNLGKTSIIVKVKDELNALQDYVNLQKIRYDHEFKVEIHADEDTLEVPLPRFVLQPLVENALYHGLSHDEGRIMVTVETSSNQGILLRVQDDGEGMTEEQLERLMDDEQASRKAGLGIGLRYVKKMVELYYGDKGRIDIQSRLGVGTVITLHLTEIIERSKLDDQDTNRG